MTRVLQVLGRSAGGIARHIAHIVDSLDGHDDLHIDIAGPPDLPVPMPKAPFPLLVPDGPLIGHRRAVVSLRRLIRDNGYDVVHAHGLRATIDASLASSRMDVTTYSTIHNLVLPEIAGRKASLYRLAEDFAVRLADHTFVVSENIASHLRSRRGGRGAAIEVLHLGAGPPPTIERSAEEVRAALGLKAEQALVVSASRLSRQKAVDVMLHAFAQLPGDPVLALLGVGPLEDRLRALATRLDLDERVRWLGFRADVADHIAAADVFCLSSIWEGVPLAAMEAIQLGTPIVATAVGGMAELIVDGHSGRLVEPRDPRALARALHEILIDQGRTKIYVERAAADLEENFSTEGMLARLRAAYRGRTRA